MRHGRSGRHRRLAIEVVSMKFQLLANAFLALLVIGFQPSKVEEPKFLKYPPTEGAYHCVILNVTDGDTAEVGLLFKAKVRLRNCDAFEMKDPGGPEAHRAFIGMLPRPVPTSTVHLFKPDKFGRVVGDFKTDRGFWTSELMIERGHATRWQGGRGPRPKHEERETTKP